MEVEESGRIFLSYTENLPARMDHTAKNPDYGIKTSLDIKAQEGEARPVEHSRACVVCVFTRANPSTKSNYSNAGHLMCLRE